MTSIYDAIKQDHERHRDLLARIDDTTGDTDVRRAAWGAFYCDVKSHAAAEEETFYSRLIAKTWGQDSARHSVHEHQQLDDLMEELNGMDMAQGAWKQKFKTLRHDYEHHIDEEEEDMFPEAAKGLTSEAEKRIADIFEKRKPRELEMAAEQAPGDERD